MTQHSTMLHVRVDDELKSKATDALQSMGLSMSDAVRLLLRRIVDDQAFPLELRVPNAATRAAMAEAEEIAARRRPRFSDPAELMDDLEKNSR